MKKLKLFQKTYLFTMILMGIIIIISHTLLYMLLPTFYINKKQQDLENISRQLIEKLKDSDDVNYLDWWFVHKEIEKK